MDLPLSMNRPDKRHECEGCQGWVGGMKHRILSYCITPGHRHTVIVTIRSECCFEFVTCTGDYRTFRGLMGSQSKPEIVCLLLPNHSDNSSLSLLLTDKPDPLTHLSLNRNSLAFPARPRQPKYQQLIYAQSLHALPPSPHGWHPGPPAHFPELPHGMEPRNTIS